MISIKKFYITSIFIYFFSLLCFGGCSSVFDHDANLTPSPFHELNKNVEWYAKQVSVTKPEYTFDWQILLTRAYLASGDVTSATKNIEEMRKLAITPLQGNEIDILEALVKTRQAKFKEAEKILSQVNTMILPNDTASFFYDLYASTQTSLNKNGEAGISFLNLAHYLDSKNKNEAYKKALSSFEKSNNKELLRLYKIENDYINKGFIEYVMINNTKNNNSKKRMLAKFNKKYKEHPIHSLNTNEQVVDNQNINIPEQTIAIFLPLTGKYANIVGNPVKLGILNAYKDLGTNINLKFYDTANTSIEKAYKEALQDKASIIIGPIIKEDVLKLQNLNPTVPVIALNEIDSKLKNVYYLTLSPNVETQNIANNMLQDNIHAPVILVPKNEKGEKFSASFVKSWNSVSNKAKANTCYFSDINSLQNVLKSCFNKNNYDAAYIYGTANEASIIREFAKKVTKSLPIYYVGSKSNNGILNSSVLQSLNGMKLIDQPWMIKNSTKKEKILTLLPKASGDNLRCFAIGYDALNLAINLQNMVSIPNSTINGLSGVILINNSGNLVRTLEVTIIGNN
ncbi:MAG: penicillin-binding protein activator [Succinivibrionaceae bacterium]